MIVFLSNYYNHHQSAFSEAMYRFTNGDYRFIETETMERERLEMGWGGDRASFVMQYSGAEAECQKLIDTAEVVIFGSAPYGRLKKRLKNKKLTFVYSERVYKDPCPSWQIPLRAVKYFWKYGRFQNLYLLCSSAYTAPDYAKTGTFLGKSYRWGYFPEVKRYEDLDARYRLKQEKDKITILWAGRLIAWKHPDAVIRVAKSLKEDGFDFVCNIIGNGEKEEELRQMAEHDGLQDSVHFLGAMKPHEVRSHMENADIYLFTSDRREGWGAVLNESMNSGCAVVASQEIGSVPFLMKQGKNGFIYQTEEELQAYVKKLCEDRELRERLGREAYQTITTLWNADIAAERLCKLIEELQKDEGTRELFQDGPCSPASIKIEEIKTI